MHKTEENNPLCPPPASCRETKEILPFPNRYARPPSPYSPCWRLGVRVLKYEKALAKISLSKAGNSK